MDSGKSTPLRSVVIGIMHVSCAVASSFVFDMFEELLWLTKLLVVSTHPCVHTSLLSHPSESLYQPIIAFDLALLPLD